MGFFDFLNIKKRSGSSTLPNVNDPHYYDNWPWTIDGNFVSVQSDFSAMKISAYYRGVDILSSGVASLPLQPKLKTNGVFQVAEKDTLFNLLTIAPNNRMNAYDFIKNAVIQMTNHGNAYIVPMYNSSGELYSLVLCSPHTVTHDIQRNTYSIFDTYNNLSGTYYPEEVIHLKNMSLDGGFTGVSTIQYASRVLSVAANADERVLDSLKPGETLKGFVSGESQSVQGMGTMQDSQLDTIATRIEDEIRSGKKIFRLPGSAKFNQLSLTAADLQLLENRKFSILDIGRFLGVHPDKLFAGQSQNYKASAQSNGMFLTDTLQPKLRQIESEFTSKLVPQSLQSRMKIEFDVEQLLLLDLESSATYMEKTIACGVYTPNYWRGMKGHLPVSGGDQTFISNNLSPIGEKLPSKDE